MKKKKNTPIITIPYLEDTYLYGNSFVINWMLFTEKKTNSEINLNLDFCKSIFDSAIDELNNPKTFFRKIDWIYNELITHYGVENSRMLINLFKKIVSDVTDLTSENFNENPLSDKIKYPFKITEEKVGVKCISIYQTWAWELIIEESLFAFKNLESLDLIPFKDSYIYFTSIYYPEDDNCDEDDEPSFIVMTDELKDYWKAEDK